MKAKLRLVVTVTGAETSNGTGGSESVDIRLDMDGSPYGQDPMLGMLKGSLDEGRKLTAAALEKMRQRP